MLVCMDEAKTRANDGSQRHAGLRGRGITHLGVTLGGRLRVFLTCDPPRRSFTVSMSLCPEQQGMWRSDTAASTC